jgi:hypothetical protein
MTPALFVKQLSKISLEDVFNPYRQRCPVHDLDDAPSIRASVLLSMLEAARGVEVDAIWIGRDLGYRGGRRTGLALTDDVHLKAHLDRWGFEARRPTSGDVVRERTAAVVWGVLNAISSPVFLWNVFPFHPHEPDKPFSNRPHTTKEGNIGREILFELINLLRPRRVIAVGNDAAKHGRTMNPELPAIHVRHPSYGGQTLFISQIRAAYCLSPLQ